MTKQPEKKTRLNGPRGLIASILITAVEDAGRTPERLDYKVIADARRYLANDAGLYVAHLDRLGLPPDCWPEVFKVKP